MFSCCISLCMQSDGAVRAALSWWMVELKLWLSDAALSSQLSLCSAVFLPTVCSQPQEMVSEENTYSSEYSGLLTTKNRL